MPFTSCLQLKTLSIVVGLIPSIGFSGWFSEEEVEKITNVVFIDYSISSATLKDNNPIRLRERLVKVYKNAKEMDPNITVDEIYITIMNSIAKTHKNRIEELSRKTQVL